MPAEFLNAPLTTWAVERRLRMKVMIDPGHGGKDPGAVSPEGVHEADINLRVCRLLYGVLSGLGFEVLLTRDADVSLSLKARARACNSFKPDIFISLHCNAAANPAANGIEVWTSPGETAADSLSREIFMAMQNHFPSKRFRSDFSDGDPDKEGSLYVLKNTRAPAVLVEMGFISHPEEREWLLDPLKQMRIALAIADGILKWKMR